MTSPIDTAKQALKDDADFITACESGDREKHPAGSETVRRHYWDVVDAAKRLAEIAREALALLNQQPAEGEVERVARAMVAAQFNEWDKLDGGDHGYWCSMARAAITALRTEQDARHKAALEDNAQLRAALREARDALHQHYVNWDGEPEDAFQLQLARAKCNAALKGDAPPPAIPNGYVLVPKRCTAQMEQAGSGYIEADGYNYEARCDLARRVYEAMLAAAPPPPADADAKARFLKAAEGMGLARSPDQPGPAMLMDDAAEVHARLVASPAKEQANG
jgi:hypothetical protein